MTREEVIDIFVQCWTDCKMANRIEMNNLFVREARGYSDPEIWENERDFFQINFSNTMDAVCAVCYGNYHYTDDYVWMNADGNLESTSDAEDLPLIEPDVVAEWLIDECEVNDEVYEINGFEEFYEAVSQLDDEDND